MFDISKIYSVYSGRKGCACGCRGKYSYAAAYKDKRPSYYADTDEGINDRTVKLLVNRVEAMIRDEHADVEVVFDDDGDWVAVDLDDRDRTYTIYFAD